jgi:hypothetical protein
MDRRKRPLTFTESMGRVRQKDSKLQVIVCRLVHGMTKTRQFGLLEIPEEAFIAALKR